MENLIFGAFATLEGYREGDAANLGRAVYDRCTVVALCSAKAQNPACTVALVTNAPPPQPFLGQLQAAGVEIWDCPFTTYRVPADTNWALAYYKLCAMDWVLAHRDFARAAMLDLDTYTQYPLDDLWREADEAVLLYQVPHAASQGMAQAISHISDAVYPEGAPHVLTHFGGELVAGSKARLQNFLPYCRRYFDTLQTAGITPKEGDEAVWCAAASDRGSSRSRTAESTHIFSVTGWVGGSILCPPTMCWTLCASCTCPAPPRTASSNCSTKAIQRPGAFPRRPRCTACAACRQPVRRCWPRCGCACGQNLDNSKKETLCRDVRPKI